MTPGFTTEQRLAVGAYVRYVANLMGLRDWTFELQYDPPPNEDTFAMVRPVYGRKVASVWFCRAFAEMDAEKARHTVVHELAHVVTNQITAVLRQVGPGLVGEAAWTVLWESTRERSEIATDQIADILDSFMPLIDWEARGDTERVVWTDEASQAAEPAAGD